MYQKMKTQIMLLIILLMAPAVFSQDHPYCELWSCPNRTHTLCNFPAFRLAGSCRIPIREEIDAREIRNIVDFHNYFRLPNLLKQRENLRTQSTAAITEPLPYSLEWDTELADIAQIWANQCENVTDTCRNVDRFNVTQRVDVHETFLYESEPSVYTSIRRWHDRENLEAATSENLSLERTSNVTPNDYRRMAWGNANKIGCGKVETFDFVKYTLYFVCNYGYKN